MKKQTKRTKLTFNKVTITNLGVITAGNDATYACTPTNGTIGKGSDFPVTGGTCLCPSRLNCL